MPSTFFVKLNRLLSVTEDLWVKGLKNIEASLPVSLGRSLIRYTNSLQV